MWRLLCLLMAAVGSAEAAPARTAFQARCEDTLDKTISVLTAQQNGYSINTQLSYKALTAMAGTGGGNSQYVLGLTKAESWIQLNPVKLRILPDPLSGYECIAPQLAFSLSYKPFVIYVGNEFAPGTCAYKEVLAHEFRHMQAYLDHLPKAEQVVRDALAKRFSGKPFYAPQGTAVSALEHEVQASWMPFIRNEMQKAEVAQVAIDAPAEYRRISNACDGEIQRILKQDHKRR
ncbi:hypothetical protein GCM10027277_35880 [Pseudoduganella ginsengisoli]|uniref:DUF922 domain-containing protein n=1 Tax=Pseudoduganella ginsengisoli TaxID=1462440 RepID=A0A6L6PXM7_9BURK|nr:hypothetical protein [Pseudoduganella ginsengisoli]MTW02210.1 hypothetical protein [Pseudoduganella ginsengisoli]